MSEKFQPGEEIFDEVEGHMPFTKRVASDEPSEEVEGHMPVMRGVAASAVDEDTEGHLARSGRLVEDDDTEGRGATRKF